MDEICLNYIVYNNKAYKQITLRNDMKKRVDVFFNKKLLLLVSSLLILIVGVSFISGNSRGYAVGGTDTIVEGDVYYSLGGVASFAEVVVECETIPLKISIPKTCDENGHYRVVFNDADNCDNGAAINVYAIDKNGLDGLNSGRVMLYSGEVDVELYNGAVVPEFGVIVGVLTILGAVGIFFVVRRR